MASAVAAVTTAAAVMAVAAAAAAAAAVAAAAVGEEPLDKFRVPNYLTDCMMTVGFRSDLLFHRAPSRSGTHGWAAYSFEFEGSFKPGDHCSCSSARDGDHGFALRPIFPSQSIPEQRPEQATYSIGCA